MYGTTTVEFDENHSNTLLFKETNISYTYALAPGTVKKLYQSRTGTNAPLQKQQAKPIIGYRIKRTYVLIPLPKPHVVRWRVRGVLHEKLQTHRKEVRSLRVPIKGHRKKRSPPLKNKANAFEFSQTMNSFSGTRSVENATCRLTGDLWFEHKTDNIGHYAGPHVQNHLHMSDPNQYLDTLENLIESVRLRHLAKVKDAKVNLAQMIGERGQTIKLVSDLLQRILRAVIKLRRGNALQDVARSIIKTGTTKELASDFLAVQYGIRPLINDVQGIVDEFTKGTDLRRKLVTKAVEELDRVVDTGTHRDPIYTHWKTTVRGQLTVKATSQVEIVSPGTQKLVALGTLDMQTLIWELTPWSFAIDWVLPIGKALSAVDSNVGVKYVDSHLTIFLKQVAEVAVDYNGTNSAGEASSGACGRTVSGVYCRRIPGYIPADSFKFPRLKNPFSIEHAANALALFYSSRSTRR